MNQQQMFNNCNGNGNGNVTGLFPNNNNNNMPMVAPPGFPNQQPFPMQMMAAPQLPNPNGMLRGFNPSQPQQAQFFAPGFMNPAAAAAAAAAAYIRPNVVGLSTEQLLVQNIYQLLQLQNSQCPPAAAAGGFNMVNVMNPQNPANPFVAGASGSTVQTQQPQNMGQGNMFLPGALGPVQPHNFHATLTNFQIPQGVGPQHQNYFPNQMFSMANMNGPVQNASQGPPGFVPPMIDVNASRQIVSTAQTNNPSPTLINLEDKHKNISTNANGGWTEGQHKNITGHKRYDPSHKGFKSNKNLKQNFGKYKGNINKEGGSYLEVDSGSQHSTNFEKKVPSLTYTEQEIKEWRESRKKNYPTNGTVLEKHKKEQALSDVTNQDAVLRRQQLKEILAKQVELGCEVAEIPASYLSSPDKQNPEAKQNPGDRKHDRQQRYKKGKLHNKRRTPFQDDNRITKRTRPRGQDSFKSNYQTKPNKQEPSLLQKLLTPDIKRDKAHLLQVFRFMAANSFFSGESLRFPSIIVRETSVDVSSTETCSVTKVEEVEKETCSLTKVDEEEGEIID